jgi:hypothetical protein
MHVERSARSAIAAAWEHRDINLWNLYFPQSGRGCESKPTNAAFISRLANGLLNSEE